MTDWVPRAEWVRTQPRALLASCVLMLDPQARILLLRYGPGHPNPGVVVAAGRHAGPRGGPLGRGMPGDA